jgi:hypothetical protein
MTYFHPVEFVITVVLLLLVGFAAGSLLCH